MLISLPPSVPSLPFDTSFRLSWLLTLILNPFLIGRMPSVHIMLLYRAFQFSSGLSPALTPPVAATGLQKVHMLQVSTQGFCDVALATCPTTAYSHLSLQTGETTCSSQEALWTHHALRVPSFTIQDKHHLLQEARPSALSTCMYTSVVAPITLYHKCLLTSLSLSLTLTSLRLGIISFHTQTPTSTPCLTHRRKMKEWLNWLLGCNS